MKTWICMKTTSFACAHILRNYLEVKDIKRVLYHGAKWLQTNIRCWFFQPFPLCSLKFIHNLHTVGMWPIEAWRILPIFHSRTSHSQKIHEHQLQTLNTYLKEIVLLHEPEWLPRLFGRAWHRYCFLARPGLAQLKCGTSPHQLGCTASHRHSSLEGLSYLVPKYLCTTSAEYELIY